MIKRMTVCGMVILFLLGCAGDQKESVPVQEAVEKTDIALTAAQAATAHIGLGTVVDKAIHRELKVNGVVDVPPQNMVSVSFPMGGYLKYTKLLPGMHVRKGEIIGMMEDQSLIQLQTDYLMTKARLGLLEKEYERQRALNVEKVNADKTLQQAEAEFKSQKVLLKGLSEKLRLIGMSPDKLTEESISRQVPLFAPTSGYVSKVNVNLGKYVQPTDVLFELINPDDIHAALTVFEKDLGKVRIGQKVKIYFVDEPSVEYAGEIILVNQNVDEQRAATIHCHFLSHPRQLLPGMFLNARIETGENTGPAVPEESVLRYQNKSFVFVETAPLHYSMIEIKAGEKDAGFISVLEGAEKLKGKNIVVANAYSLLGALKNVSEE